jgi:hypothetical protein
MMGTPDVPCRLDLHRFPPLSPQRRHRTARFAPLVLMAVSLVYWLATTPPTSATATEKTPASAGAVKTAQGPGLTPQVTEMRNAILAAVQSGNIDELKLAIEWNEMPPEFGDAPISDPIGYWKRTSADGEGREILAVLGAILAMEPARLPIGRDPENNTVFVWPYLAEVPLDKLTPAQEVDLYRLMPVAEAKTMRSAKKWTWWRLSIGADGTWLTFMKHR